MSTPQSRTALAQAFEWAYRPAPGVVKRKQFVNPKIDVVWRITPKLLNRKRRGLYLTSGEIKVLKQNDL